MTARVWLFVGALGFASVSTLACKKDAPKEDVKDDKTSKSKDKSDNAEGGDDEKYSSGDVLKHVPKSCPGGRAFLDLGLFLKNEAVAANAEKLDERAAQAVKGEDGKKFETFVKTLKKGGLNPVKAVKQIALCVGDPEKKFDDMVVAIGGKFAGKDPLKLLKKAIEGLDEKVKSDEEDGIDLLRDPKGTGVIAQITPNVFTFTSDTSKLSNLKKSVDRSADWNIGKGRILSLAIDLKKKGKVDGSITDKGDELEFKVAVTLQGKDAAELEENADAFKKKGKAAIEEVAKGLSKGMFKKIADDVRHAKIEIDGKTVTVTMTSDNSNIAAVIKAASEANEEDLENVLAGR